MSKPRITLEELLAEIDRICPPESEEQRLERRERVTKQQERARVIQKDMERS